MGSGDPTEKQRWGFMNEKRVAELYEACGVCLDVFHIESHRTLDLLALVSHSPHSTASTSALHFQLSQEKAAQTDYQRHRLELLRGLLRVASGGREPQ
jgi:hypothetical protein